MTAGSSAGIRMMNLTSTKPRRHYSPLFLRTVRSLIVNAIVPLLLLSFISSVIASNFWKSENYLDGENTLIQYMNAVDNRVSFAQRESVRLATDPNVISFILAPGFDDIQRNTQIMKSLNDVMEIDNAIEFAYVFSNFRKLVLASDMRGYRYGELKDESTLEYYVQNGYHELVTQPASPEQGFLGSITIFQNVPYESVDTLGCACLRINLPDLFALQDGAFSHLELAIYDQSRSLLYTQDYTGSGYQSAPAFWEKLDKQAGAFQFLYGKENLIVFHKTSPVTGWTYVGTTPMPVLFSRYDMVSKTMLFMAMVAVILSLILSYRTSTKLTQPITALVYTVSGRDNELGIPAKLPEEYQYVRDAYNKMLHENNQLADIMDRFRPNIKNHFFFSLLIGEEISEEEIRQKLTFLNEGFAANGYAVIIMAISNYDSYSAAYNEDEKALHAYQLQNEVEASIPSVIPSALLRTNRYTWALVMNTDDSNLVSRAVRLICGALTCFPFPIKVEAGAVYSSPRDLRYSYREALEKVKFSHYQEDESAEGSETDAAYYPGTKLEDALIQSIRIGSSAAVQDNCNALFDEMRSGLSVENAILIARRLTDRILEILIILDLDPKMCEACYSTLEHVDSIAQVNTYIQTLSLNSVSAIEEHNRTCSGKNIERLIEYINQHLHEDISLQDLADECQISPSYVSRLFKEKLNIGFVEYLNTLRVDRARKLLEDTQMNVEQIGYQVGFNHVRSFIRTFKQYVGTTPGQYRKKKGYSSD